jgi:hypothetical protein
MTLIRLTRDLASGARRWRDVRQCAGARGASVSGWPGNASKMARWPRAYESRQDTQSRK